MLRARPTALAHLALLLLPCALAGQDGAPPPDGAQGSGGDAQAPQQEKRGLVLHDAGAYEGYTLFTPLRETKVYLIDMAGEVVHTWDTGLPQGGASYLEPDGHLLRCARQDSEVFHGGGQGGRLVELDWDGKVLWDLTLADQHFQAHHDVERLPNGHILVIAWEKLSREEAIAAGRDPAHVSEETGIWPDEVLEIVPEPPNGYHVVWEWHSKDHLIQDLDPTKADYGDVTAHPERIDFNADVRGAPARSEAQRKAEEELAARMRALGYTGDDSADDDAKKKDDGAAADGPARRPHPEGGDWLHTNAIDYRADLDLILLSSRHLSEVWVIDHSTTTAEAATSHGGRWGQGGDLLYRWGNPQRYGRGTAADQRLFGQHDPEWLPSKDPGEVRFMVFNNGQGRPAPEHSSVDEVALPFSPEKGFPAPAAGALLPAEAAWSYVAPDPASFYSSFVSSCERLPNGNTLICSGEKGRIFEITPEKKIVWEYLNPFTGNVAPASGPRPGQRGPGGPPAAGPGDGRPAGPGPGGPAGAPPRARGGGGSPHGLFRALRFAKDDPAVAGRL